MLFYKKIVISSFKLVVYNNTVIHSISFRYLFHTMYPVCFIYFDVHTNNLKKISSALKFRRILDYGQYSVRFPTSSRTRKYTKFRSLVGNPFCIVSNDNDVFPYY